MECTWYVNYREEEIKDRGRNADIQSSLNANGKK